MNFNEFKKQVEKSYSKYFPNSLIKCEHCKTLGDCIDINCYMAKDKMEVQHGYFINDMIDISFSICINTGYHDYEELTDEMILVNNSKFYKISPTSFHYAFECRKISFRKTTGNAYKIINTLDKFFKKLYYSIIDDYNNNLLRESDMILVKNKLDL